jgi:hypothetical protein
MQPTARGAHTTQKSNSHAQEQRNKGSTFVSVVLTFMSRHRSGAVLSSSGPATALSGADTVNFGVRLTARSSACFKSTFCPSHLLHTPCFARALLAAAVDGSSTVLLLLTIIRTGSGCLQASVAKEGSGYLPVMSSLM